MQVSDKYQLWWIKNNLALNDQAGIAIPIRFMATSNVLGDNNDITGNISGSLWPAVPHKNNQQHWCHAYEKLYGFSHDELQISPKRTRGDLKIKILSCLHRKSYCHQLIKDSNKQCCENSVSCRIMYIIWYRAPMILNKIYLPVAPFTNMV